MNDEKEVTTEPDAADAPIVDMTAPEIHPMQHAAQALFNGVRLGIVIFRGQGSINVNELTSQVMSAGAAFMVSSLDFNDHPPFMQYLKAVTGAFVKEQIAPTIIMPNGRPA